MGRAPTLLTALTSGETSRSASTSGRAAKSPFRAADAKHSAKRGPLAGPQGRQDLVELTTTQFRAGALAREGHDRAMDDPSTISRGQVTRMVDELAAALFDLQLPFER